jgi:hypothetical protein
VVTAVHPDAAGPTSSCDAAGPCLQEADELASGAQVVGGVAAGSCDVTVAWAGQESSLALEVTSAVAVVAAVTVTAPSAGYVAGETGSEHVLTLEVAFTDGTSFPAVRTDGAGDAAWVGTAAYLSFAKNAAAYAYATVTAAGLVVLQANTSSADAVGVAAAASLDGAVAGWGWP